jgi:hypothetical protein
MLLGVSLLAFFSTVFSNIVAAVIVGIIAGLLAAMLVLNMLLGPTCKFQLQTAVQTEPIHALGRLRKARKIRDVLVPLVEAAQGRLVEEAGQSGDDSSAVKLTSPSTQPLETKLAKTPKHEHGRLHALLFYLLLLWIPSLVFDLLYNNEMKNHVDFLLQVVSIVLAILALVKQRRSDLPMPIRSLTAFWLIFMIVMSIAGTLFYLREIGFPQRPANLFDLQPPLYGPFMVTWMVIADIGQAAIGFIGLRWLYQFRRQTLVAEPAPEHPE